VNVYPCTANSLQAVAVQQIHNKSNNWLFGLHTYTLQITLVYDCYVIAIKQMELNQTLTGNKAEPGRCL